MKGPRLERVRIVEDRTDAVPSGEGFLRVRRWVLQSTYDDGTTGPTFRYDTVEREALDAVAIAAWERSGSGASVWIRRCLRPPLLSRTADRVHVPLGWPEGRVTVLEVPAGLVDRGETGLAGVVRAAARELFEETGIRVTPDEIRPLGAPFLVSPGVIGELIFPVAVEVAAGTSPSGGESEEEGERGAEVLLLPLDEAIARVEDAKSEITLRRLREALK